MDKENLLKHLDKLIQNVDLQLIELEQTRASLKGKQEAIRDLKTQIVNGMVK